MKFWMKKKENYEPRNYAEDNGGYQNFSWYHVKINGDSPLLKNKHRKEEDEAKRLGHGLSLKSEDLYYSQI